MKLSNIPSRVHRAVRRRRRGLALLLGALPFAAVVVAGIAVVDHDSLDAVLGELVGASLAIAVFAVNFSFLALQLSPYRAFVPGVPDWQLVCSAVLLVVAIAPLLGLAATPDTGGRVAFVSIGVGAYAGLLLVVAAQRHATPMRLLARATQGRRMDRFVAAFVDDSAGQIAIVKRLDDAAFHGSDGRTLSPPMHELAAEVTPPALPDDPAELCVGLASAAIRRGDSNTFMLAVERAMRVAADLAARQPSDEAGIEAYRLRSALRSHGLDALARIGDASVAEGASVAYARRLVDHWALHVRRAVDEDTADSELTRSVAFLAAGVCRRLIEQGRRGEETIALLVACRQVCERALRPGPEMMAEHRLAAYASIVAGLGEIAIERRDEELVYRVIETLVWIIAGAIRSGGQETGRRGLEDLVDLARLARHRGVGCFDVRCARGPYEHVEGHMVDIVSWVDPSRERWLKLIGTAWSRLVGHEIALKIEGSGDDARIRKVVDQSRTHVESVEDHGFLRAYDYSNPAMTDRHPLH